MKSITFDFEGEPVEIPFTVSDFLVFSSRDVEVLHNGSYYVPVQKTISDFDNFAQNYAHWDQESTLEDMNVIIKMKKK